MASSKKLLFIGVPVVAAGGVGVWMLMGGFLKEPIKKTNSALSPGKVRRPKVVDNTSRPKAPTRTPSPVQTATDPTPPIKNTEPNRVEEGPRELEQGPKPDVKVPVDTIDPPENNLKVPDDEEQEDPMNTEDEVPINDVEEKDLTPDPNEPIVKAGLDCRDASEEIDCSTGGESGINVEWNGKKGTYEPYGDNNGTFKLRISDDLISTNKFSFTITKNPIKLQNKENPEEFITLEKYEHYGLERGEDEEKVYLRRNLSAEQGMIRSLGLPNSCSLPKEVSAESPKDPTCKLTKEQIGSVNFEGKKEGGATTEKNVNLYIQKVSDTTTYRGGYKFTFSPEGDVVINENDKIKWGVQKDFMLKDPKADDLVLEKVWKDGKQLLSKFGLKCGTDNKCTVEDGFLKIKDGNRFIEDGKKKGDGNIYLEWKEAPYYEGLMFSVWGGMTIESKSNPETTIEMEELGIYYITKEEKGGSSSYYLTRKEAGVDDMLKIYLGVWTCPPRDRHTRTCQGKESDVSLYKFHDGKGKKHIKVNKGDPGITIVITPYQKNYPFGYKFTLNPEKEIKVGDITIEANKENNFKIRKDIANRKLYLEKVR